ncbi:CynX/NimT family MFS transporter [Dinoroseobacter sp. S76]|uniref:MFS transporter n=1 Tax=Dinoroseobacter sp. S76 TaxID=3415124 RepID=UPI003C7CE61B
MRWRILALLFLARIGLGLQFQTMGSVGDHLIVAFGFDWAEIGLLIGLFMAPGLVLALPAGYWGRFVSDRVMVGTGLGVLALGSVLCALAAGPWTLGAGRVLSGVGFLFTTLYFTKMVADWFDGREIATAMSILVMSWPLGIAMGQVGHAWLAALWGWQSAFVAASIYTALAGAAVLLLYREPPDQARPARGTRPKLSTMEWRLIFCAAGAWALFNAAYVVYLSFGPQMLEAQGQTTLAAAGVISLASWLMIFSGAACGQLVDRFGRRSLVLSCCMVAAIAAVLWLGAPAGGPGGGVGASLLFGLVGMAPAGVIMALAGQALRPENRAFGMGVFFTIYYALMMVTPPVAGALFDLTGAAEAPLWLAAVLFALVVPLGFGFEHFKTARVRPAQPSG